MQNALHTNRNMTFTNTVAVVRWRRYWTLSLLLCMVPLVGCLGAKFHRDFSSVAAQPSQPSRPLVGAWEGSWQSSAEGGKHAARAVVSLNSQSRYDIQLELSAFEPEPGVSNFPFDKYWIELRQISVTAASDAVEQFQTKTRIEKANRSNLISEAMTLQGNFQGDSMQIRFSTNDALHELDQGRIELRRIAAQGALSPISSALAN